MPAHLQLLLSLLAYLCHPTSRALTSNLAPARAKTTENQQKDRKSPVMLSCDSSWMSVGLSKYSHSPADVRQEDTRARRQERTSGSGKSHWPRKTYARAFRSMNLNALRRLGVHRRRHGVDQQVLVDILTPSLIVIWFALIARAKFRTCMAGFYLYLNFKITSS